MAKGLPNNIKPYVKALVHGTIVFAGTTALSPMIGSSLPVDFLSTEIPFVGITILNSIVAGGLVIVSSLILDKVKAF